MDKALEIRAAIEDTDLEFDQIAVLYSVPIATVYAIWREMVEQLDDSDCRVDSRWTCSDYSDYDYF
jgi:hypothetical protein